MDRRKILIIFAGAWVSAALLTWFLYASTQGPKTEKMTPVVAVTRDIASGSRLKKSDVKLVRVVDKDVPKGALFEEKMALDRVLMFPVSANEVLATTKLASSTGAEGIPAIIEQGMRAVSVPITDMSAAGGYIQPRSHVDVLFTRTGTMKEALTTTILQDVVVLSIGRMTEAGQTPDPKASRPQNQAATLMVTPEDAGKLELARNQGRISLALRNPMDRSVLEEPGATTAESLDPMLFAGTSRTIRAANANVPNVRDDRVWNQITGEPGARTEERKEPSKPRLIVDVYRGDKHVQEIFQ